MPKVNKLISSKKCQRCRHDKQKCLPEARQWPGRRCERCIKYDYVCSANRTRSQEQSVGSGENLPVAQAPSSTLLREISTVELLQEKADLHHIERAIWRALERDVFSRGVEEWARLRLTEVIAILTSRAQQFVHDGKFEDAEYIYTRMTSPPEMVQDWELGEQSANIIPIVVPLYEKTGNFAAAEAAQESRLFWVIEVGCSKYELILDVEKLHQLYTLFYQRIRGILASCVEGEEGITEFARSLVWYRTARLYLDDFSRVIAEDRRIGIPSTALHIAAHLNDVGLMTLLLEKGKCEINAKDSDGDTALHIAGKKCRRRIVEMLLEANADVTIVNDRGETALLAASNSGPTEAHRIAKILLEKGADVNAADTKGTTALHLAVLFRSLDIINVYLSSGVDVDARDLDGDTPLMVAAKWANTHDYPTLIEIALQLLQAGADVNASDQEGRTPLMKASAGGYPRTMQLLIASGANVGALDCFSRTALHFALQSKLCTREEVISTLVNAQINLESKDDNGWSALSIALRDGLSVVARRLLEHGADVEANIEGETLLFYALRHGDEDGLDLLLEKGANVNTRNGDGETPLMVAVSLGKDYELRSLMLHGADVEAWNTKGETPLSVAVHVGDHTVVQTLIDHGADVESKGGSGGTPLQVAVAGAHGPVVKILLDGGAIVSASAPTWNRAVEPLLHCAIRTSSLAIVEMLLGTDPNAIYQIDLNDNTTIHQAILEGHEPHERILSLLLARFPYFWEIFTTMNIDGNIPLHLAILRKRFKMAKMLLTVRPVDLISGSKQILGMRNSAGFDIPHLLRITNVEATDPAYGQWMELRQAVNEITEWKIRTA